MKTKIYLYVIAALIGHTAQVFAYESNPIPNSSKSEIIHFNDCENDTEPPLFILPTSIVLSCAEEFNLESDPLFTLNQNGFDYTLEDNCSNTEDILVQIALIQILEAGECSSEFTAIYYFEAIDESNHITLVDVHVQFVDYNAPHEGSWSLNINGQVIYGEIYESGADDYWFVPENLEAIEDIEEIAEDGISIDIVDDCGPGGTNGLQNINIYSQQEFPYAELNYQYCDECGNCGGFTISFDLPDNLGCIDQGACNYNPWATESDGSCAYNDSDGNGICDDVQGCIDPEALNYDPDATGDDGTCIYETSISLLEIDCDNENEFVLQVTHAQNGLNVGGNATAETRTIYAYLPDAGSGSPTYEGESRPYVIAPHGINISSEAISATISTNADNILLINGYPAYQYTSDSFPDEVSGIEGPWTYFFPNGDISQDVCGNEVEVSGFVNIGLNCSPREITVSVFLSGSMIEIERVSTMLAENGLFTVNVDVIEAQYDVYLKVEGYLSKGVYDTYLSEQGTEFIELLDLKRGDINGDDLINFLDFSSLNQFFGSSTGAPNYDLIGDPNCDGVVNFLDASSLNLFFGEFGEEP